MSKVSGLVGPTNTVVEDTESASEFNPADGFPFVPLALDDAGLTLIEFRVYCHVCRRCRRKRSHMGDEFCNESVRNMARFLNLHHDSVRKALAELVRRRFLSVEKRPSETWVYRLRPIKDWKPSGETVGQPSGPTIATPSGLAVAPHSGQTGRKGFFSKASSLRLSKFKATGPEEQELMALCFQVLGPKVMGHDGGKWRNRIRLEDPDKVRRVMVDVRSEQTRGTEIPNVGGYAEDLWKRFA